MLCFPPPPPDDAAAAHGRPDESSADGRADGGRHARRPRQRARHALPHQPGESRESRYVVRDEHAAAGMTPFELGH